MKKTYNAIADIIRKGACVKIKSDDFRFSEISGLARIAANNGVIIQITVGDNINASEIADIAAVARQHVMFDYQ